MRILTFGNELGFGGTEKALSTWARRLHERGHKVRVVTLADGPRRAELELAGIPVSIVPRDRTVVSEVIRSFRPEVIHCHAPGHPHPGDILGEALKSQSAVPVVQTNVFGRLENPSEDLWVSWRLFISWISCVQAARRCFRSLDASFFRRQSVAVYPVEEVERPPDGERAQFRRELGVRDDEILLGRLSRPDPRKWMDLPISSFRLARRTMPNLKLLLREPPPSVAQSIEEAEDRENFIVLPATSDCHELALTLSSLDLVLHTSSIGESFGYGIAEPMKLGIPVIANLVPWIDQAQVELVRHQECGFLAGTVRSMAKSIITLARQPERRSAMGEAARKHISALSDPENSTNRLETILRAAIAGKTNPFRETDLLEARAAAEYLDQHQFGHSFGEWLHLLPWHWRVRFHQWRHRPK